jgi:hypothetical protein
VVKLDSGDSMARVDSNEQWCRPLKQVESKVCSWSDGGEEKTANSVSRVPRRVQEQSLDCGSTSYLSSTLKGVLLDQKEPASMSKMFWTQSMGRQRYRTTVAVPAT